MSWWRVRLFLILPSKSGANAMSLRANAPCIHRFSRRRRSSGSGPVARHQIRAGATVCGSLWPSNTILILQSGIVRIGHHADPCRVHYRLQGCEGCILSALWSPHAQEIAVATAETDLVLISMPQRGFDDLMKSSARFRRAVFQANAKQVLNLLQVTETASLA